MNGLDLYTLIFLVIAVVIFLRLRSVLGKRTGTERPPFDPYGAREDKAPRDDEAAPERDAEAGEKVITLPRGRDRRADPADLDRRIGKLAEKGSALDAALRAVMARDQSFDPEAFVQGAKMAYEMIVTAFNAGDKKTLKPLLAPEVFDGFSGAIDARIAAGESAEVTFVGIDKADIIDAEMDGRSAEITMRFASQMISVIRDRDGKVVDGDPQAVETVVDVWAFARDVSSSDPNWKLVRTESQEA